MSDYEFFMDSLGSLIWLMGGVGVVFAGIYTAMKAIPKNADPTKRSVLTVFGKPLDLSFGPVQATTAVGYLEIPKQIQIKMPTTVIESKDDPPVPMEVRDWNFTIETDEKNPTRFLESGGEEEVILEMKGMLTAAMQEFSANNSRFGEYEELKKAQPWMIAAVVNYLVRGDVIDLADDDAVHKLHDQMASKKGHIRIEPLGVKIIQMDIGRVVEPQTVIEANTAVAEQEKENEKLKKKIEGVVERLAALKAVDPNATLEMLQIQEGIRPADERKITVQGIGEADKLVGGLIAAGEAFAKGQQPPGKKK